MKVFRAFLVALLVPTVVWGVVFYESQQAYRAYKQDYYEWFYAEYERAHAYDARHVDPALPDAYWAWNGGGVIWNAGMVLWCAWLLSAWIGIVGTKPSEARRSD